MEGMSYMKWYKSFTTSELIDCVTRLTREMQNKPYSPYVEDELRDVQIEVEDRLSKLKP